MKNKCAAFHNPTICLFGASLDVGNMGCRALSVSLIKLFLEIIPNVRIFLVYGNNSPSVKNIQIDEEQTISVEVINYRLSPRAKRSEHLLWILLLSLLHRLIPPFRKRIENQNKLINTLVHAEFAGDIRGGDSFSDIYGFSRLFFGTIPILITRLLQTKLVLLPQTYGPYRSVLSRVLAKFSINSADKIYARDRNSISVINTLIGKKRRSIEFCPDVAFTLHPVKPAWYEKKSENNKKQLIGLNISGLLFEGGYNKKNMFGLKFDYKEFPHKLILAFLKDTDADILLVPHVLSSGIENDLTAAQAVYSGIPSEFKKRIHIMDRFADQSEIKYIIGTCDFFIGSRMHACIAALSQGIPTVGIAYSQKFKGVFESIGLENNVIDARFNDEQVIIEHCLDRYEKGAHIEFSTDPARIQHEILERFNDLSHELIST